MSAAVDLPSVRWPEPDEAWIGLGANLGDRAATLDAAVKALPGVVLASPLVETEPWGLREQPWFLNGVARLRWGGSARELLRRCLLIERELGRVRVEPNGPRAIDLDVLILGQRRLHEPELLVPHPGIARRRSVLEPWARVAPELLIPGLERSVEELRRAAEPLPDQEVRAWEG